MARAFLVFNGASGAHLENGKPSMDASLRLLGEVGVDAEAAEGGLGRQVKASLSCGADMVVVDGGDGTIRSVIGAHVAAAATKGTTPPPIGILPAGTMNLLAKDYGVPVDRRAAAEAIAGGLTRAVDVGVVRASGRRKREEIFLHTCLTGLPVRLGVHRENRRGRLGWGGRLALGWHALTTISRDPMLRATFGEDGSETLESRSFAMTVGELDRLLLPAPTRISLNGGVMTVIAISPEDGAGLIRLALRGTLSGLRADRAAAVRHADALTLTGPRRRTHVMVDGESLALTGPLMFKVVGDGVRILVPESAEAAGPGALERSNA